MRCAVLGTAVLAQPRAGTFIYHSHFDEERQLGSGLYGPLIASGS